MKAHRITRRFRLAAGLLLPATLAVLGIGATPLVLCHAPGCHLAVEPAAAPCAAPDGGAHGFTPDAGAAPGGACPALAGAAAEDRGCTDTVLALHAVLSAATGRAAPAGVATLPAAFVTSPSAGGERARGPGPRTRPGGFACPRSPILLA